MIDVSEQGTEAAAATGIGTFTASSLQPQRDRFRVDRPFVFTMIDDETNAVLFKGRIDDPRQAS